MALSNIDRELLNDCISGNEDAWRGFCERYIALILHSVQNVASSFRLSLDEAARNDLVADVFLAVLENDCAVLRQFRGESSLASYLVVIARRTIMKQLTHQAIPRQELSMEMDTLPDNRSSQSEGLTLDSPEMLQNLSSEEASAIRMFHFEGKSYREIGTHLGMSENSIGPFLSRAREKLRQRA